MCMNLWKNCPSLWKNLKDKLCTSSVWQNALMTFPYLLLAFAIKIFSMMKSLRINLWCCVWMVFNLCFLLNQVVLFDYFGAWGYVNEYMHVLWKEMTSKKAILSKQKCLSSSRRDEPTPWTFDSRFYVYLEAAELGTHIQKRPVIHEHRMELKTPQGTCIHKHKWEAYSNQSALEASEHC